MKLNMINVLFSKIHIYIYVVLSALVIFFLRQKDLTMEQIPSKSS